MFKNVCYSLPSRQWVWHQRSDPPSALPQNPEVDINGTISWFSMTSLMVKMAAAYNHIKEHDETLYHPFTYEFRFGRLDEGPLVVDPADNSTTYLSEPHFFVARTLHDDNLGHLVFDTYAPILTAIESFLGPGLEAVAPRVTVVDVVNPRRPFGSKYFPNIYKKWLDSIAKVIFRDYVPDAAFFDRFRQSGGGGGGGGENRVCFAQLLVGCGGLSGLEGQSTHHRHRTVDYVRQAMWRRFVPRNATDARRGSKQSAFPPAPVDLASAAGPADDKGKRRSSRAQPKAPVSKDYNSTRLNILLLQKVDSHWKHDNNIKNWAELVQCVQNVSGPYAAVLSVAPNRIPFEQQVRLLKEADVVISLWGGISMVNFLMPPDGVEVLFSAWFDTLMPLPNATLTGNAPQRCVDFDDRPRSAFRHKVLLFCSRDDGMKSNNVNLTNFEPFLRSAVAWKRSVVAGLTPGFFSPQRVQRNSA